MRLATLGGHHVLGDPENTAWFAAKCWDYLAESRYGGLRGQLANLIGEPASEEHPHLRKPHAAAALAQSPVHHGRLNIEAQPVLKREGRHNHRLEVG